jgi:hypothetical protein
MTAHQHTAGERPYLPPMGRRWLLPLYDPMTRLAGVSRVHEELAGRADLRPGSGPWRSGAAPAGCGDRGPPPAGRHRRRMAGDHADRILDSLRAAGLAEVAVTGHGRVRAGAYTFYRAATS